MTWSPDSSAVVSISLDFHVTLNLRGLYNLDCNVLARTGAGTGSNEYSDTRIEGSEIYGML